MGGFQIHMGRIIHTQRAIPKVATIDICKNSQNATAANDRPYRWSFAKTSYRALDYYEPLGRETDEVQPSVRLYMRIE